MKLGRRILASFMALVVLGTAFVLVISIVHFVTMERAEAHRAAELDDLLHSALPDAETLTELADIPLADGVMNVYAADNGAGYVMRVRNKAITEEHGVFVAMTPEGRIVAAFPEEERPGESRLISEDILSAFTKTMGNYNTSFSADVMSQCVVIAREQLDLLPEEEVADEQP